MSIMKGEMTVMKEIRKKIMKAMNMDRGEQKRAVRKNTGI